MASGSASTSSAGPGVVEKLKPLLKARDEQRPIPDQRLKLGTYLRTWLEDVAKPTIRASTYKLHLIPGLGRIPLAKLTPIDVQAFLTAKQAAGLSPRRIQMLHAVLRRALRIAEEWGYVSRIVAKLVHPPRVTRKEIAPLTPEQAGILIKASKTDRLHALYVTALGTGLRQGELLGLGWEDVDMTGGRLTVRHTLQRVDGELVLLEPKTERSRRTIHLPGGRPLSSARSSDPPEDGAPRRGFDLGRLRTRLHHGPGHPARCRNRDPFLPAGAETRLASPTSGSTTCGTRRPRSCSPRASRSRTTRTCSGTAPSC